MKTIDLRSDTVTLPSQEIRNAISNAKLGDDVFQEDPNVNLLESEAALVAGKEAALLVPSGTMGNLISLGTHLYNVFPLEFLPNVLPSNTRIPGIV